ncbi:MAG: hypothetical protein HY565_02420 [Candidatus Kerfeldbacteria bacterium]|nr:hypothetical protein [Candidatus Kerfeldbacteria bacterium]
MLSIYSRVNGITPYLFSLDPTPGPIITESEKRLQALAEKKLLDTDSDGINDFDEEFTYGTSALIADTDSDGIDDGAEIAANTNPVCAAGDTCFSTVSAAADATTTADLTALATDDPVELRRQLVALGIDQAVLDQVSDADLLTVYASVQSDYQTTTATANTNTTDDPYAGLLPDTTDTTSVTTVQSVADLENLSPDAVRTLLVQSGMKQSDLDQVDDATLMEMYQQALQESQQTQ